MCLIVKEGCKPEIAKKDITCWKVVMDDCHGKWVAPYHRSVHEYNTELKACGHLVIERNHSKEAIINYGFHAYTFKHNIEEKYVLYHIKVYHIKVVECTIPKGAEYCLGEGGDIVATRMIVHKPRTK